MVMAKLTEQEIAEIRRAMKIKPEDIGKRGKDQKRKPSGLKAPEPPEWLRMAFV